MTLRQANSERFSGETELVSLVKVSVYAIIKYFTVQLGNQTDRNVLALTLQLYCMWVIYAAECGNKIFKDSIIPNKD